MEFFKTALVLLALFALCSAKVIASTDTTSNAVEMEKSVNLNATSEKFVATVPSFQSHFLPTELSLKNGVGQALIVGGVVVASVLILGAIALFLTPVFSYKLCYLLGTCDNANAYTTYSAAPSGSGQNSYNDVYGAYIPANAYANYQKRSLEYVGPILKVLNAAYEKYGQHSTKKE